MPARNVRIVVDMEVPEDVSMEDFKESFDEALEELYPCIITFEEE